MCLHHSLKRGLAEMSTLAYFTLIVLKVFNVRPDKTFLCTIKFPDVETETKYELIAVCVNTSFDIENLLRER